jgi:hypothetical protein
MYHGFEVLLENMRGDLALALSPHAQQSLVLHQLVVGVVQRDLQLLHLLYAKKHYGGTVYTLGVEKAHRLLLLSYFRHGQGTEG